MVAAIIGCQAVSTASAAAPSLLWEACSTGSAAGQCNIPRGVAADSSDGRVFVADQENRRIVELTAWGEFVRTWGWDVIASGPDNNGVGFEICVPANGDICKAGAAGAGAGQFGSLFGPQGLAVDSSGDVYVTDSDNFRVQKFDSEGHFLRMWGRGVNAGTSGNAEICTNAGPPTDVCGAGAEGTGNGQFSGWARPGDFIAIGLSDQVYVGDKERIQRFDTAGVYQGQIAIPGETVQSLATDSAGNLYLTYLNGSVFSGLSKPNVHKLTPTGATGSPATFTVADPRAVTVDAVGDVYTFDPSVIHTNEPQNDFPPILEFDSGAHLIAEFGKDEFSTSTGLTTNLCAGSASPGNLYVANSSSKPSFLRAYGTAPKGCEAPPPKAPQITAQYAVSVGTDSALVRAQINPHFIEGTAYYVEYGTGDCAAGGCPFKQPLKAAVLGGGATQQAVTTAGVVLTGLSPGTSYHYRFVAQSSGGGPEYGLRPIGEEEDEGAASFAAGREGSLATPVLPGPLAEDCPNQAFRTGPSAFLPDCRAYEMVSPVDKNGGGIETGNSPGSAGAKAALDQSAAGGAGVTYSSKQAFGDAIGSPFSSQYVSSRDPGSGWTTHSINSPHEGFPGGTEHTALDTEYKAFSQDLSRAWLIHFAEPPLAPCGPQGSAGLYRRDNLTASYEALHCRVNVPFGKESLELQGISADGCRAVFRARGKLTEDAEEGGTIESSFQLYESSCEAPPRPEGPLRLVGIKPDGVDCRAGSSAGSDGNEPDGRSNSVWHAFSTDGGRSYWTCGEDLFLREHPDRQQSALLHGGAEGTGKLTSGSTAVTKLVAAKATGTLSAGSSEVSSLKMTVGQFVVGQPIAPVAGKIPVGVTVVEVGTGFLKLSAPAEASAVKVPISSPGPAPFAVGQSIVGSGIPAGATITAVGAEALTLSAAATETKSNDVLEASSECTEAANACTRRVAAAACTPEGCVAPRFEAASADGSRMLFIAKSGGEFVLRSFDAASGETTTIASGLETAKGRRIDLMGASEDATRAYFASIKVLTDVPNSEGDVAVEGEPNLYLYRQGIGFSFIGTLAPDDLREALVALSPVQTLPLRRASRVSPDGLHAAFISTARLTDFDNTDVSTGEVDAEVFAYDATANSGAGKLVCVSCNAVGARPVGQNVGQQGAVGKDNENRFMAAAYIPGWQTQLYQGRPLSENGRRLFFNSFDPLVNRDTNSREDVYEWEQASSAAECEEMGAELFNPKAGGCISLITSGQDPSDSEFIDADKDGSNVFVRTAQSLVGQDPGLVDVYDARIGGGFPEPPPPKASCEGEGCQNPPAPPVPPTPASSVYQGPANPTPAKGRKKCLKGKRKARCPSKRQERHHRRARREHRRVAR